MRLFVSIIILSLSIAVLGSCKGDSRDILLPIKNEVQLSW